MVVISRKVSSIVIIAATVTFLVSFLAQFFIKGYQPDPAIYGMFSLIGAAALQNQWGKADKDK